MNKNFFLIIVVLIFVILGCKRNKGVCGLSYEYTKFDHARLDYSIIDTIINDEPNQYIISGEILKKKEPLIGANILISNLTIGTVSDVDGKKKSRTLTKSIRDFPIKSR